ncbi:MAG: LysE family transporter [Thermofilum sp.]
MIPLSLAMEIIGVTASGALSPGPLTFAAIVGGRASGAKYGLLEALGHTAFELPLFVLLGLGCSAIVAGSSTLKLVSALGGISLLAYAVLTLRSLFSEASPTKPRAPSVHPIAVGFMLTAFNPFFIAWWLSAGVKLVTDILTYSSGLTFLLVSYATHVWMDYAWLAAVAHLARTGGAKLPRGMTLVQVALTLILAYYGLVFLSSVFT